MRVQALDRTHLRTLAKAAWRNYTATASSRKVVRLIACGLLARTCRERPVFGFQHSDGRPWVLDELRKVSAITNKDCYFHQGSGAETPSKFLDSLTNVHRKMRLTRI